MENKKGRNAVVVFAKEPDGKSAKTRIAAKVGNEKAAEIYNELLHITVDVVKDMDYYISYSSNGEPHKLENLFKNAVLLFLQVEGDLGDKMKAAFKKIFSLGYSSVTAIGTDCPYVTSFDLEQSSKYLEKKETVVIGPASDGGYYLIGCREETLSVLDAEKWSTSKLFDETLSIIEKKGYNCLKLEVKDDIDEIEDYFKFKKRL